jgi:SAM-dependent methyltransferase
MDHVAYAAEARIESSHWWFVGRRRLFAMLIRQARIPANATVVDIGTGTGANLRLLRDMGFTHVTGIDPSSQAARWCAEKGLGTVERGDIRALPLQDGSVDLVLATDVAEHVEEDRKAFSEICRVLRPGGVALITVPAFPSLWGLQDERSHHYRRYRMTPFVRLLDRAGLQVERKFHFNYLLFVPIYLARLMIKVFGVQLNSENELNSPLLNRALKAIFTFDIRTAPYLNPPFGVSILALARRPREGDPPGSRAAL